MAKKTYSETPLDRVVDQAVAGAESEAAGRDAVVKAMLDVIAGGPPCPVVVHPGNVHEFFGDDE